jgi:hypothetical protein
MAISVEHLGGQVKCPHCQGVVQTPAPVPSMELNSHPESIFAGPEASDAVIGETAMPKLEMPPPSAQTEPEPEAELPTFKPRPVFTSSVFAMYALIFLVPYAILTTIAILYLIFNQTTRHPFDMIRDPMPDANKGGAKRAMLDPMTPLAPHQRVAIGKQLQVGKDGDLLVTPERIVLTEDGDLRLFLRAKNISKDTTFEPCNERFVKYNPQKNTPSYTFLQSKTRNLGNVFGAYLEYRDKADDNKELSEAILRPDQEILIVLTTYANPHMKEIAKGNDSHTWRIELRRGMVKYAGKDVSATTVIGVEFNSSDVGQETKKG